MSTRQLLPHHALRSRAALLTAAALFAAGALLLWGRQAVEREERGSLLQMGTVAMASAAGDRLHTLEVALRGLAAVFEVAGEPDTGHFRAQLARLGLADFQPAALSAGFALSLGRTASGDDGGRSAPVVLVEGAQGTEALALDLLRDTQLGRALEHTENTGELLLATAPGAAPGDGRLGLYLPVHLPGAATPDHRPLRGWLYVAFGSEYLLGGGVSLPPGLHARLLAGAASNSGTGASEASALPRDPAAAGLPGACLAHAGLAAPGGPWTLCVEAVGHTALPWLPFVLATLSAVLAGLGARRLEVPAEAAAAPAAVAAPALLLPPGSDALPCVMACMDADYGILAVNHAFCEFFGQPAAALVGQRFTHLPGGPRLPARFPGHGAGGRRSDQVAWTDGQGRERWMSLELVEQPGATAEPAVLLVATEVTTLVRRGERAQALLQAALDAVPVPVVLSGADTRITHLNRAACRLLGRPAAGMVGLRHADVCGYEPDPGAPASSDAAAPSEDAGAAGPWAGWHATERVLPCATGEMERMRCMTRATVVPGGGQAVLEVLLEASAFAAPESAPAHGRRCMPAVVSGSGPASVDAAVGATLLALAEEFPDLDAFYAERCADGGLRVSRVAGCFRVDLQGLCVDAAGAVDYLALAGSGRHLAASEVEAVDCLRALEPALQAAGVGALLQFPLLAGGELGGVLGLAAPGPRPWTEDETACVRDLARLLEVVMQAERSEQVRAEAQAALVHSQRHLRLLNGIAFDVARGVDAAQTTRAAVERLQACFPGAVAAYAVRGWDGQLRPDHVAGPAALGERIDWAALAAQALASGAGGVLAGGSVPALAWLQARVVLHDGTEGRLILVAEDAAWGEAARSTLGEMAEYLALAWGNAWVNRERRAAEEALRQSERALQLAAWTSGVGLWTMDLASGRYAVSPHWLKLFGFAPDEAPASQEAWQAMVHPDDRARLLGMGGQDPHGSSSFEAEYRLLHRDGHYRWVLSRWHVERDEAGTPVRQLGGHIDITPLKRAQEDLREHRDNLQQLVDERTAELRAAKEVAEQANMAKSQFLANMSHELRTPMHAILAFAQLGIERLQDVPARNGPLAHYLERIRGGGERLMRLLNDLLDLSKLESGKMAYQMECIDVAELAADVVAEFAELARKQSVVLVVPPAAVPTLAWADAVRVGQVLRNLVSNALKFSPPGAAVHIGFGAGRLALAPGLDTAQGPLEGPALQVTVRDAGCGIPVAELDTIFQAFVQSSVTASGAGGTGLGLAICREIVDHHHGRIWAENNMEGGASVHFLLPCVALRPEAQVPVQPAQRQEILQ